MASGEKALLDTFYISTRRGRRFASLPELDLSVLGLLKPEELFIAQGYSARIANAVIRHLDNYEVDISGSLQ